MKQIISYFSWLFVLSTLVVISPAHADLCITPDENEAWRARTAYIVAGLTVIGVAGAIVALSNASGHHKHHTHSSSSWDSYNSYHHHGHYHNSYSSHHHHKHHHHHSSSLEPISERDSLWPINQKIALSKDAEEETQISGVFASHCNGAAENQGSFTAFVQLPDGTTRTLGRLSLSGNGGTSLHYGPYDQKGTYTFGISLDQTINSPEQMKAGSVEIQVNGSAVQKHDFTLPPHAAANYEPAPCCFDAN